jgi:hypothetical protein
MAPGPQNTSSYLGIGVKLGKIPFTGFFQIRSQAFIPKRIFEKKTPQLAQVMINLVTLTKKKPDETLALLNRQKTLSPLL